ncbi:hypothetical protein Barb7_03089 [Bacteroidales bacterium Barb7]|nr:hypothetical protein Barb7_03089 [Bacteroidales bacterium Barb7]
MSHLCAEFRHLVHFVHAPAGKVVETVKIGSVGKHFHGVVGAFNGDNGFKDAAFTVLYPLPH